MTASDSVVTARSRLQFTIRSLLLLTTAVAVVLGCWQWLRRPTIYSLPPLGEIKSMKVLKFCDIHDPNLGMNFTLEDKAEIEVAKEDWKDICDAISPSDYDPHPLTWQCIGTMEIQTRRGERYWLGLFWLYKDPVGAFCVGRTSKDRTYRRGGNSAQLIRALEKAYSNAATQKTPK